MHRDETPKPAARQQTNNSPISDKKISAKVKEELSKAQNDVAYRKTKNAGYRQAEYSFEQSNKLKQSLNSNAPLVKDLGENFNLSDISKHVKDGDVGVITSGGKQTLYVNENGIAKELKLSKEKFEELFPKTGFALSEQKGLNNCWLISRLNSMTETPAGRAELYSMLEETPDGGIIVRLPGTNKTVTFPAGQPVNSPAARLGEGASPGLEMIHQAVLVRTLKNAEDRVDNVSQLNLTSLQRRVDTKDLDSTATKLLLNKSAKNISGIHENFKEKITQELENFVPGKDMATSAWGSHQRNIVNYNKDTKLVTFHDPYYGSVDISCSLDDFLLHNPSLSIVKGNSPSNIPPRPISQSEGTHQTSSANKPETPAPVQNKQPEHAGFGKKPTKLSIPAGYTETRVAGSRAIIGPNKELFFENNGSWHPGNRFAREVDINSLI